MKVKLLLTEKYSVARDLARELSQMAKKSCHENEEGFFLDFHFEKEGLCKLILTYSMGHLFEIDDEIVPAKWSLENLPLFPEKFRYRFRNKDAEKRFFT